jgi:hypothetical protein
MEFGHHQDYGCLLSAALLANIGVLGGLKVSYVNPPIS